MLDGPDHRCAPTLLRRSVRELLLVSVSALFGACALLVYEDWVCRRAEQIMAQAFADADLMVATYDMDEDQAEAEADPG